MDGDLGCDMRASTDIGRLQTGTYMRPPPHTHTQTQLTTDGGILMWPLAQHEVSPCLPLCGLTAIWAIEKVEIKWEKLHLHDNKVL